MIHKYIGIRRRTNSSLGTAFYLYVVFTVKKEVNVGINDGKVVITFVAFVFLGKLSSDVLTAFIPSEFGIFACNYFTSSGTRYELSGTVSIAFGLLIKFFTSLTYDGICLTVG